jgi:hypothetical protein
MGISHGRASQQAELMGGDAREANGRRVMGISHGRASQQAQLMGGDAREANGRRVMGQKINFPRTGILAGPIDGRGRPGKEQGDA